MHLKTYSQSILRWLYVLGLLHLCYLIIFITSSPTKAFAQDSRANSPASNSSLSNILNKVANEKIPDNKNLPGIPPKNPEQNTEKLSGVKSISEIVSSLTGKKNNITSLMFSTEEIDDIEKAMTAHKNNQPFDTGDKSAEKESTPVTGGEVNSCVYLGSILYHSPNSWAVWVNGQKISNSDNKIGNEIYVRSISDNRVSLVWTMSISKWKILADQKSDADAPIGANNQVELNFDLSFNQTYMLIGNKIIEGRITSASLEAGSLNDKALTKALKDGRTQKP